MKEKKLQAVERFVSDFDYIVKELENFSGYLRLGKDGENVRDEALAILKKKVKKMKNAESMDDIKKVVKVKKIYEKEGL